MCYILIETSAVDPIQTGYLYDTLVEESVFLIVCATNF